MSVLGVLVVIAYAFGEPGVGTMRWRAVLGDIARSPGPVRWHAGRAATNPRGGSRRGPPPMAPRLAGMSAG
jgi:hypothetical protein